MIFSFWKLFMIRIFSKLLLRPPKKINSKIFLKSYRTLNVLYFIDALKFIALAFRNKKYFFSVFYSPLIHSWINTRTNSHAIFETFLVRLRIFSSLSEMKRVIKEFEEIRLHISLCCSKLIIKYRDVLWGYGAGHLSGIIILLFYTWSDWNVSEI